MSDYLGQKYCQAVVNSMCKFSSLVLYVFIHYFFKMHVEEEWIFLTEVWWWRSRGTENQATVLVYVKSLQWNQGERLQNPVSVSEHDLKWLFAQEFSELEVERL